MELFRLDLKNCSFVVTWPTLYWRCHLKTFYWTFKKKTKNLSQKTFPNATDYLIITVYFSNARLNSIEHEYYFPQVVSSFKLLTMLQWIFYDFSFHTNAIVASRLTGTCLLENLWKYEKDIKKYHHVKTGTPRAFALSCK